MSSFSRLAFIAYLFTQALPSARSADDYCNLNDTMTLNMTSSWDLEPCTRGDGVSAYTDPAGGCCVTLDITTCTAHDSCTFVDLKDTCGICMSVEYVNEQFTLNGTTCEETSAQWLEENPMASGYINFLCDDSTSLDCCYDGNYPDFPDSDVCDDLEAEECVADDADSECWILYNELSECYTCQYGYGLACADIQTWYGANSTLFSVYCESSLVGDAEMCIDDQSTTEVAFSTTEIIDDDLTTTTAQDSVDDDVTTTKDSIDDDDTTTTQDSKGDRVYVFATVLGSVALLIAAF